MREIRLFGSWARGEAGPESDTDVAIVIDELTHGEWGDVVQALSEIELAFELSLSPLILSSQRFEHLLARERRIARDILTEGIPL